MIDKLFAAILAKRLLAFLPLHDNQFAYRPKRGTTDAIFVVSSVLAARRARHLRTYMFSLDIYKAFDTVWHDGLFRALSQKGVTREDVASNC